MKLNLKTAYKISGIIPHTSINSKDYFGLKKNKANLSFFSPENTFGRTSMSYLICKAVSNFAIGNIKSVVVLDPTDDILVEVESKGTEISVRYNKDSNKIVVYYDNRKTIDFLDFDHLYCYPVIAEKYFTNEVFRKRMKDINKDLESPELFCQASDEIYYLFSRTQKSFGNINIEERSISEIKGIMIKEDYTPVLFDKNCSTFFGANLHEDPFNIQENEEEYFLINTSRKSSVKEKVNSKPKVKAKSPKKKPVKKKTNTIFQIDNITKKKLSKEEKGRVPADVVIDVNPINVALISEALKNRDNILFIGPTATGKTTLVEKICHDINIPLYEALGDKDTTSDIYLGEYHLKDSETVFKPGAITLPLKNGGVCFCDEFNNLPANVNTRLNTVLDHRRRIEILGMEETVIEAHSDFFFVAAMNVGEEYAGVNDLNFATFDRFDLIIEFDYLKPDQEIEIIKQRAFGAGSAIDVDVPKLLNKVEKIKKASSLSNIDETAENIIEVLNKLRKAKKNDEISRPASTRTAIGWLKYSKVVGPKEAAKRTIIPKMATDIEERRTIEEIINMVFR